MSSSDVDSAPVTGKTYKVAGKPCNVCGQQITWECRIDNRPAHVDAAGYVIRDGKCPGPRAKPLASGRYIATPRPPTPGNFLRLVEEARVNAIRAMARLGECVSIADKIIAATLDDSGLSRDAMAQWNKLTNAERAMHLANLLSSAGWPTDHPQSPVAILARAEAESTRYLVIDNFKPGPIDVLLDWCQIAGIDLGFDVRA